MSTDHRWRPWITARARMVWIKAMRSQSQDTDYSPWLPLCFKLNTHLDPMTQWSVAPFTKPKCHCSCAQLAHPGQPDATGKQPRKAKSASSSPFNIILEAGCSLLSFHNSHGGCLWHAGSWAQMPTREGRGKGAAGAGGDDGGVWSSSAGGWAGVGALSNTPGASTAWARMTGFTAPNWGTTGGLPTPPWPCTCKRGSRLESSVSDPRYMWCKEYLAMGINVWISNSSNATHQAGLCLDFESDPLLFSLAPMMLFGLHTKHVIIIVTHCPELQTCDSWPRLDIPYFSVPPFSFPTFALKVWVPSSTLCTSTGFCLE